MYAIGYRTSSSALTLPVWCCCFLGGWGVGWEGVVMWGGGGVPVGFLCSFM